MEFAVTVGIAAVVVLLGVTIQNLFKRNDSDPLDSRLGRVPEESPSRSLILEPVREDWDTKFDRSFETMVTRTGLDLPGNQGLIAVLGAGAILAGLFYYSGREPLEVGLGFALGSSIVVLLLYLLQGGWRRRVEAQFPDAYFFWRGRCVPG
jgi:Flp pilus assembly protein TadB